MHFLALIIPHRATLLKKEGKKKNKDLLRRATTGPQRSFSGILARTRTPAAAADDDDDDDEKNPGLGVGRRLLPSRMFTPSFLLYL